MSVTETVTFHAPAGTAPEAVVAAWQASMRFVQAQAGFQSRSLGQHEDGSWLDIVIWADMDSAHRAKAAFDPAAYPELMQLLAVCEEGSMEMKHYTQMGTA